MNTATNTGTAKVKAAATISWQKSRQGVVVAVRGAGRALDRAKRSVTQQDAFEAYNAALDDLTRAVVHVNEQLLLLRDEIDRFDAHGTVG